MTRRPRLVRSPSTVTTTTTSTDLFVTLNGKRIAKRGHPGTPQARTWMPLEPGWTVKDTRHGKGISIEHDGLVRN